MKTTLDMFFNIVKVMIVVFVLIIIVAFLTGAFSKELLCGLAFGSIFSILNLRLLSLTLEKAVTMHPGNAQGYVLSRYIIRFILSAVVLAISFKAPYINAIGTIIGLLLPKITILIVNLFGIEKIIKGKEA
ncbi:ATP synthase subunit I [Tepidibacter hydrothermalis]|uniref:ATP synthase subunit I n=1 Tax=Tepidibacter hydrothermalis TaxID=3036126 RepID=A0ABY8EIG1_9FIRM|nr:ATP synthase subunit I [Tepidibacter hydrothermalis]WFD10603.1 ATP synthase subunit I [Tepidibacter hydrothermalis]